MQTGNSSTALDDGDANIGNGNYIGDDVFVPQGLLILPIDTKKNEISMIEGKGSMLRIA